MRSIKYFMTVIAICGSVTAYAATSSDAPTPGGLALCRARSLRDAFHESFHKIILKFNSFETKRELTDYEEIFGPRFTRRLRALKSGSRWVDVGAGIEAAQREFQIENKGAGVETTAISLRHPSGYKQERRWDHRRDPTLTQRHTSLTGKTFDEYKTGEIGKADLVTDLFGALSYSKTLDTTLHSEIELLKEGGDLHFKVGNNSITILDQDGNKISFWRWLKSIKGVHLVDEASGSYHLIREIGPIEVPKLIRTDFKSGRPPVLVYTLAE